ncbi:prepilin peptidase [Agrococcus sp. SL85]|uniref:prepilin peptidase n=1 Tax=Agrococcus sp. SL85 TaxID=2995141 RepID=UPI00226CF028|nr:prepilin peptidase [Agrococcus sp. SL85]WAC66448.1 prepilin peptidase [Agrococcus sp. SL85]
MTAEAGIAEAPPAPPLRLRPIDLLGAPLAALAAWAALAGGADGVAAVALAACALAAPALARIDQAERRLPNALTLPLLAVGVAAAVARLVGGDLAPLAALGCGAALLGMAVAGGMGMGDVKLGTALALVASTLGWAAPVAGLVAAILLGGLVGAVLLALGRRSLAFGPWLLLGAAAGASLALV